MGIKLSRFIHRYFTGIKESKKAYVDSMAVSLDELKKDTKKIFETKPQDLPHDFLIYLKDLVGSGLWISYAYYHFIKSFYNLKRFKNDFLKSKTHVDNLTIINDNKIHQHSDKLQSIFKSIFEEYRYSFIDKTYIPRIPTPNLSDNITIAIIPGVFNEFFKDPPFQRGLNHIEKMFGIKNFQVEVAGHIDSKSNSHQMNKIITNYIKNNPKKKIWLLAYSKGGVDTLHFLKRYPHHKNYILGLSTIASPILGSLHVNHRMLKLMRRISMFKSFSKIDQGRDLLKKEFQRSLSAQFRSSWFYKNHQDLPKDIFYSSISFESDFKGSHFWMMAAKMFFPSPFTNDGIVDSDFARFPDYFDSLNLGTLKGHHLSSTRSSSFSQEALILSHLTLFEKLNLLNKA